MAEKYRRIRSLSLSAAAVAFLAPFALVKSAGPRSSSSVGCWGAVASAAAVDMILVVVVVTTTMLVKNYALIDTQQGRD